MKIISPKNKLVEAINIVQKAIASKSVMPILECIKFETIDEDHVLLSGTNVDITIEYTMECRIDEGGSIALASKIFGDIIRKMPDGDVQIEVTDSNNVTKISCGASEFNIQGQDPSAFPKPPVLDEMMSFEMDEAKLRNLIRKALPFIAVNDGKRPVITGGLIEIKNGTLNFVTTDSHRIAVLKEEISENIENIRIVVPGQTLRELIKILNDSESSVRLVLGDRKLLFEFEKYKLYTRLLDGDFLRYESIISAVNPISVEIDRSMLTDCLERAILLINDEMSSVTDKKVPVRLKLGFGKVDISCITGRGQVKDSITADITGDELEIGFNCRFLLDALNVCDDDVINLEFSTPTSGCFIRSASGDTSYVYMILPVRLYN